MRVTLVTIQGRPELPAKLVFGLGEFLFGRSRVCDVRFGLDNQQGVSRRHCALIVTEGGVSVRDLRSRHGTWVNSVRVTETRALRHGDRLSPGGFSFLVLVDGADLDAEKRQPLVNAGKVLHVAGEAIERLDDDHIEGTVSRPVHQAQ